MSRKRNHRRPRKLPHGDFSTEFRATSRTEPAEGSRSTTEDQVDVLRRQAARAGVPELLAVSDEGVATAPPSNVIAARRLLEVRRAGGVTLVDPAAVFDLAHLAMVEHFGLDPADLALQPTGDQLTWLTDLCQRAAVTVERIDGRLTFGIDERRFDQYKTVSLLAVRRLALVGAS